MTSTDVSRNAYAADAQIGSAEPTATARALLLLGRGTDLASERGVDCPGELPPASDPDLVERVRTGAPLNDPDPATFYGGGEAGYTDYPTHAA